MSKTYEMAIALSGKIDKSLGASVLSAAGALSGLEKKLSVLNAAQQKAAKYDGLQKSMAAMKTEYQASQAEAQKLAGWMSKMGKSSKVLQPQFDRAQAKSEKLREKLFAQRKELVALESELAKTGVGVKNLARFEEELAAKAAKASAAQAALQKSQAALTAARDRLKLGNIQGELMESGAIFMALKKPIQAAAQFETTMAEIRKVVDFESPEAFKAMGADLQDLSLRIPMTTEALGKIYAAGGQSGIAQKDLLSFTETAAKMGIAFDVSADQAGEWMAKWRTAFKMDQAQVTQLADQINYLGNNTAATAAQISDVVSRIGPLGAVGNVAAEQIAALGASMIGAGQSEEVAATGVKNFMLALTAGQSATDKQAEAFKILKIDPEILAREMMKDPEKVMTGVLGRLAAVDKSRQAAVMTEIFGKQAVPAISALLTNLEETKKNFSRVSGEGFAGSMEKEFAALADTATNSFRLAQNAASVFSQNIGNALLPNVKSAAVWLVDISSSVLKFSQAHPEAFDTFVKAVAALGALRVAKNVGSILGTMVKLPYLEAKTAVLALRGAWIAADGSLLTMIKSTKIAATVTKLWTGAQWLLNAAFIASPIGWIVLAVGALIGGFILAYKKCDWFREKVNSAMAVIGAVFGAAVNKVMSYWNTLKPYFETFWKGVKFVFFFYIGLVKAYFGTLFKVAQAVFSGICAVWQPLSEFFAESWETIKAVGLSIWNPISEAVKVFADGIYSLFGPLFGWINSGFEKIGALWSKFKSWAGSTMLGDIAADAAVNSGIVAAHAAGGMFNRPHLGLVAEDGVTESIIPHSPAGESIWQATGEMAGFSMPDSGGGDTFSITANLTVNAQPGMDGDEIGRQALKAFERELPRLLRRCEEQRLRVAY